jgi:hypothetical protein
MKWLRQFESAGQVFLNTPVVAVRRANRPPLKPLTGGAL